MWELGDDDAWRKAADVAPGTLPVEAGGDRTYFGGGAGAVYDGPRSRLVFWINDGDENDYWLFGWGRQPSWSGSRSTGCPTSSTSTSATRRR